VGYSRPADHSYVMLPGHNRKNLIKMLTIKFKCIIKQVSESPLLSLSTQEHGKIMAVGSKDGRLSVIQISDNLSTVTKNDKVALTSV
jgi:hypothetical protein